jgi:predicted anti-sigma-YlaC factor YlaD
LTSHSNMSVEEVICEQFVELITDYFEGALGPRMVSRIEEHLVMCDWCRTYAEQMEMTIAALGSLSEEAAGEPGDPVITALRSRQRSNS